MAPEVKSSAHGTEPDESSESSATELLVDAMADPVRCKILSTVSELSFEAGDGSDPHQENGITVRALSARIGEPRRKVRYHLDVLCEQGLVEVAAETARGGVVERRFVVTRSPTLTREEVTALGSKTQKKLLLGCLKLIFADAVASLESGAAVRRPDWAIARVPGRVDEQGRKELSDLHVAFTRQAQEVIIRARRRMEVTKESQVRIVSANLFFEAARYEEPAG